jgi:hypothetical protein
MMGRPLAEISKLRGTERLSFCFDCYIGVYELDKNRGITAAEQRKNSGRRRHPEANQRQKCNI